MGQAKLRKSLDPNYGIVPKRTKWQQKIDLISSIESLSLKECEERLFSMPKSVLDIPNEKILEILSMGSLQPRLFLLWIELIRFNIRLAKNTVDENVLGEFWDSYWRTFSLTFGSINISIRSESVSFFLSRIKGILNDIIKRLLSDNQLKSNFISNPKLIKSSRVFHTSEVTLDVGIAYQDNPQNILFQGINLLVFKGQDQDKNKGELSVCVKSSNGCWSLYPLPDNNPVPLSDYKNAKAVLANYSKPLKSRLIHEKSAKIARLLGMEVRCDYAYLEK